MNVLTVTTESPLPALKQELFDLSDRIITLQFEVLQFNGNTQEKEKFSTSFKSLQSLVADMIKNLASFDPTKTKDKIHLAREAFATLLSNWGILKSLTTTTPLSTSVATTISK